MFFIDGKGKNAVETLHTARAPLHIAFEQNLRIGMAAEGMAFLLQLLLELGRII